MTVPPWSANPDELMMLTLYEHPSDWPKHYVIRACYIRATEPHVQASAQCTIFREYMEALLWIGETYPELTFRGRNTDDEPQILGVWM